MEKYRNIENVRRKGLSGEKQDQIKGGNELYKKRQGKFKDKERTKNNTAEKTKNME